MTWQYPFPKSTITSRYGEMKPPRTSPHRGLDLAPGARKLIPAITDGVVTAIFYSSCLGWVCEVRSDEHGIHMGHSHLFCNKHNSVNCNGSGHEDGSTCMSQLKVGDRVKMGQPIGRVGNSGTCSRGSHLHLTFSKKPDPRYAKMFDPERFLDQKIAKQEKNAKGDSAPKASSRAKKEPKKAPKLGLQEMIPKKKVCRCCKRPL